MIKCHCQHSQLRVFRCHWPATSAEVFVLLTCLYPICLLSCLIAGLELEQFFVQCPAVLSALSLECFSSQGWLGRFHECQVVCVCVWWISWSYSSPRVGFISARESDIFQSESHIYSVWESDLFQPESQIYFILSVRFISVWQSHLFNLRDRFISVWESHSVWESDLFQLESHIYSVWESDLFQSDNQIYCSLRVRFISAWESHLFSLRIRFTSALESDLLQRESQIYFSVRVIFIPSGSQISAWESHLFSLRVTFLSAWQSAVFQPVCYSSARKSADATKGIICSLRPPLLFPYAACCI
jgi:hypothetical protein